MNLIYKLKYLLIQTKYIVHDSLQINVYIPELTNWIDLILETETHFICFKDIWSQNHLTINILNDYLNVSEYTNSYFNINSKKKYIFVLLIKNNNLNYSDIIFNKKNIYIIKNFTFNELIKNISNFLYSNNIYFYDCDESTLMLE